MVGVVNKTRCVKFVIHCCCSSICCSSSLICMVSYLQFLYRVQIEEGCLIDSSLSFTLEVLLLLPPTWPRPWSRRRQFSVFSSTMRKKKEYTKKQREIMQFSRSRAATRAQSQQEYYHAKDGFFFCFNSFDRIVFGVGVGGQALDEML